MMPRRAMGSATRKNAPARVQPSVMATCSIRGSMPSNVSLIARMPNDADTNNWQSTMPLRSKTNFMPVDWIRRPRSV